MRPDQYGRGATFCPVGKPIKASRTSLGVFSPPGCRSVTGIGTVYLPLPRREKRVEPRAYVMTNQTTRREFLKAAPLAASAIAIPSVAAAAEESPLDKVNRLGWELSHALNDYWDGKMHAVIYPSDQRELAVGFIMTDLHVPPKFELKNQIALTKEAMERAYPGRGVRIYSTFEEDPDRATVIIMTEV